MSLQDYDASQRRRHYAAPPLCGLQARAEGDIQWFTGEHNMLVLYCIVLYCIVLYCTGFTVYVDTKGLWKDGIVHVRT